jgi:hypothetical protein
MPAMADPVKVDASNFARAETTRYMADIVAKNGIGMMVHGRTPTSVDDQPVVRMNMDTLYSSGLYDLAAGPITVTIPASDDGRYLAVEPVSEEHFTPGVLHEGSHVLSQESVGSRYVALLMRVFVDPNDPADVAKAHALQDAVTVTQEGTGSWEPTDWDKASLDQTRDILLQLGAMGMNGFGPRMGAKGEVDAVGHLIATASGWGLNPESEAIYLISYPEKNDGQTQYQLVMRDVSVDGFWSVTVYDKDGYMPKNPNGRNAVNNVTSAKDSDGAVTIRFGGCDGQIPNCLPITEGWNYTVRLYRPRAEVQDGRWTAPEATPLP